MAAGQIAQKPDQVTAELTEIGQRSRQVIREIRRTIFALRPLDWSSDGFLPSLRRFVNDFAEQLNWRVSFDVDDDLSVPDRVQPTVFRLVQESLNNVAKHAEAEQVWIELSRLDEASGLSLCIRDNGVGFDPATISGSGLGLQQMQKRIEAVGGVFMLESKLDGGTTVSAQILL
jgi:signal transduction histidine kinase